MNRPVDRLRDQLRSELIAAVSALEKVETIARKLDMPTLEKYAEEVSEHLVGTWRVLKKPVLK